MKKRKYFAALTACAVSAVMLPGLHASAVLPRAWGVASAGEYADMTLLDDRGIFSWLSGNGRPYLTGTAHCTGDFEQDGQTVHREWDELTVLYPRINTLTFTLEGVTDEDAAVEQVLAIVRNYYPDVEDDVRNSGEYRLWSAEPKHEAHLTKDERYEETPCMTLALTDLDETAGSAETAGHIMHDLAAAGLISAFYSWGETANYDRAEGFMFRDGEYLFEYTPEDLSEDADRAAEITAYLEKNAADCTLEIRTGALDDDTPYVHYLLHCGTDRDFPAAFGVVAELYEATGIMPAWLFYDSVMTPVPGRNLLVQKGDLNIDGSVSIADAILLARYLAEDSEAPVMPAGRQNAELDGDTLLTAADLSELMRLIAGIG